MTGMKPFAFAIVVALVSGSTAFAKGHDSGTCCWDWDSRLVASQDVDGDGLDANGDFLGVELDLDADLTYSGETTDTETSLVRK